MWLEKTHCDSKNKPALPVSSSTKLTPEILRKDIPSSPSGLGCLRRLQQSSCGNWMKMAPSSDSIAPPKESTTWMLLKLDSSLKRMTDWKYCRPMHHTNETGTNTCTAISRVALKLRYKSVSPNREMAIAMKSHCGWSHKLCGKGMKPISELKTFDMAYANPVIRGNVKIRHLALSSPLPENDLQWSKTNSRTRTPIPRIK